MSILTIKDIKWREIKNKNKLSQKDWKRIANFFPWAWKAKNKRRGRQDKENHWDE